MSNKTQLQTNNTNLDALIARVNAAKNTAASLPEAGNSEDLSAELTEQANLIAQQQTLISNLETALENKASGSGGGSIETCTVTINYTNVTFFGYAFLSNNGVECVDVSNTYSGTIILENVVKNSPITLSITCLLPNVTVNGVSYLGYISSTASTRAIIINSLDGGTFTITDDD